MLVSVTALTMVCDAVKPPVTSSEPVKVEPDPLSVNTSVAEPALIAVNFI